VFALAGAALVALVSAAEPAGGEALVLGVLQEYPIGSGVVRLHPEVRAAFVRRAGGWEALPIGVAFNETFRGPEAAPDYSGPGAVLRRSLPESSAWRVCFDGKPRGAIRTTRPPTWTGGHRGALEPEEVAGLPWADAPTDRPWLVAGRPAHRPLVTTTGGHCGDPDRWSSVQVAREELLRLLPAVHTEEARVFGHGLGPDKLYAVENAYGSVHGDRLLMVTNSGDASGHGTRLLIHLARGGELRILAEGVSVLDTGDYDGDGESELVAIQSGTEGGSVMLFWDGFRRQARFDGALRDE
jgi:hypothetical protein